MGQVFKCGLMVPSMRENGVKTKRMAKGSFGMPMEMYTKVSGRKIKRMDTVFMYTSMALNMMVTGKMICKMVKVLSLGVMAVNTKAVIKRE